MADDTTTDPSTLVSVNNLLANMGALGLAIYSDVTGKPIITSPGPGNSVVPVNAAQSSLNNVLVIGLIAIVVIAFVME
jgi:hypothetical protein